MLWMFFVSLYAGLPVSEIVLNNTCWPQKFRLAFWFFSRIELAPCLTTLVAVWETTFFHFFD